MMARINGSKESSIHRKLISALIFARRSAAIKFFRRSLSDMIRSILIFSFRPSTHFASRALAPSVIDEALAGMLCGAPVAMSLSAALAVRSLQ
jgi:hypothetical protein